MPNHEIRLQVNFECDSKSKSDVGGAPSGGSKPSKMDVTFFDLGYLRSKTHISIRFECFSPYTTKKKRSGNVTTRRAIPRSYRNLCFKHAFHSMKVLFRPFESVEHLKRPQTGIWKSHARAEYKNDEIKVSHAWQVHTMPLRNIKLRQLYK